MQELENRRGAACAGCAGPLCGHEVVMSLVLGFKGAPSCLSCLARGLEQECGRLRDHLREYVARRPCWRAGWEWADRNEGPCLRSAATVKEAAMTPSKSEDRPPVPDSEWDAGDMGCGDLVLELRMRLLALKPGQILKVTARDPGAPADMPAWCGLTGHALIHAKHPVYFIRRKEA